MEVIVDSSVWIDYFRGGENSSELDFLIDNNLVVSSPIILAELIPYLKLKKQNKVISLLQGLKILGLEIDWDEVINNQLLLLKAGLNGVGIPDLLIEQTARQHAVPIYTLDRHFFSIAKITGSRLYS